MSSPFFKTFASSLAMTAFAVSLTTAPALAADVVWYQAGWHGHHHGWHGSYARWPIALTWSGGGGASCYNRYGGYDYFCNRYFAAYDQYGGFLGIERLPR